MPLKISDTTYFFQRCHQHLGDFCIHEYFCEFETLCENTSANTFWAQMGYNPKKPVSIISCDTVPIKKVVSRLMITPTEEVVVSNQSLTSSYLFA